MAKDFSCPDIAVYNIQLVRKQSYACLGPAAYLQTPLLQITGAVLAISLLWISIAQHHMGSAWRIGLDYRNKTPLCNMGYPCFPDPVPRHDYFVPRVTQCIKSCDSIWGCADPDSDRMEENFLLKNMKVFTNK